MSESDHLNSTNNTGNTFISLDQASTIMADQTQGGNPQQIRDNSNLIYIHIAHNLVKTAFFFPKAHFLTIRLFHLLKNLQNL